MFNEKIHKLLDVTAKTKDSNCMKLINDLITSATEYFNRVTNLEITLLTSGIIKDLNEYKDITEEMVRVRETAHDALIHNVKAVNRLCRLNNLPLIFEGDESDRVQIADFAKQLIDEIFSNRIR